MAFPWATRGVRKKGCAHGDEKFESMVINSLTDQLKSQTDFGALTIPGDGKFKSMVTNSSTDQLKSQADFGALTMLSNFELLQHKNSLPETLPEAPYAEMSYSYFALTTFRSTSNTPAPKKFFNAVESFLEQTPLPGLRLCTKQHWELHYEFFHRDKKNEFIIKIFGDSMTGRMQSCFLVEIHHHSGKNHVPFQNLAESIRQRFHMDYAFELPFLKNGEPSNRFRKCAKTKTVKVEWSPSELDIILAHIESPYADVRAPGWEVPTSRWAWGLF